MNEVEHVLSVQDELGECPIWHEAEQALYWVDIEGYRVHCFEPETNDHQLIKLDFPMTAFGLRASGGWVTAAKNGLAFWDPAGGEYEFIADPVADRPQVRFNDAVVSRDGRFWIGTLREDDFYAPDSALYRLEPNGSLQEVATGFATSNGIGFSPDGKTLYFVDMFNRNILAYDHDPVGGELANRRIFASVPEADGYPDGLTIDSEGFVWNAHWGGWKVTRYDPTGQIERQIRFPAQNITRCAFGGPDLTMLYVTSAKFMLEETERENQPLAGDLFRVETGVRGLIEPRFRG